MSIYVFTKQHPIKFKILRAALVAMLGESGQRKEDADKVTFKWPGVTLLYHFTSSMAGSSYVSFFHKITDVEKLIKKMHEQATPQVYENAGQIQYINLKDKSGQSVAYVQFSFAPKGQLSYAGIKHAINLMTDSKPIENIGNTIVEDTSERVCEWEDGDDGALIRLFSHTSTNAYSTKSLQLRVHPKCKNIIALATSFITLQPDTTSKPRLGRAASK